MFRKLNLIIVGLLLLILFTVATWLVAQKIDATMNGMHKSMEKETGNYRSELIALDFKRTEQLEKSVEQYLKKNGYNKKELTEFLTNILPLDVKISRIWFLVGNEGIICQDTTGAQEATPELKQTWRTLTDSLPQGGSRLYTENDLLYWTITGNVAHVTYGFDISLPDLHTYFAEMRPMVRSYAFILQESGTLIYHPDEIWIGKKLADTSEIKKAHQAIQENRQIQSTCFSEFLSLTVERIYYPIPVGPETWIVAVNIVQLENQEEMSDFRRFTIWIVLSTILIFSILLAISQYKWRKEYDLRRKAERQALELNMQQLKNQINPHFLFNSLNSLSSLIGTDTALAKEFVLKLSKVYRYLLEKRNESLATVGEELEFAKQYYFLQKIRFGEQLTLEIETNSSPIEQRIPVLSLQMLIENAIKHNEVTRQHPLHIVISVLTDRIVVANNYQPRADVAPDSIGVGFENLREIYAYYSKKNFEYRINGTHFICELPFI